MNLADPYRPYKRTTYRKLHKVRARKRKDMHVYLSDAAEAAIIAKASEMGITKASLAGLILEAVSIEGLFAAVLDLKDAA